MWRVRIFRHLDPPKPLQKTVSEGERHAMADLRFQLNDKAIERLPPPENGRYIVRDTELKGFFPVVGARKKTFTIQGDLREEGKRASTIRVAIGDT